jgi:SAM-dependent methyltransferase
MSTEAGSWTVDYDPTLNDHSTDGPMVVFEYLFRDREPSSILDVGCGPGAWLSVATSAGVEDAVGIDGLDLPQSALLVPKSKILQINLMDGFDLGRMFDWAFCLEVAEHLEELAAPKLIESITRHADRVLFSAACPGQPGQHHVNCQWPEYWQRLFNECGFACDASIRGQLWNITEIEPWYRQNLFIAKRSENAGREERIVGGVQQFYVTAVGYHLTSNIAVNSILQDLSAGSKPFAWYLQLLSVAWKAKISRAWRRYC